MPRFKNKHRTAFFAMCNEVAQAADISLDLSNIHRTFGGHGWMVSNEQSMLCSALTGDLLDRVNSAGIPLVATATGGPQYRDGFDTANTLGLKIIDHRYTRDGHFFFPVAYDVFNDGRRVLEVFGLRLDSGGRSWYRSEGTLATDLRGITTLVPDIHPLVIAMISSFPVGHDKRAARLQQAVLSELMDS